MAEGLARAALGGAWRVQSAGSAPSVLNPLAVAALREVGLDIAGQRSKSVHSIDLAHVDIVVTLCAEEVCPHVGVAVRRLHWPVDDPATTEPLSDDEKLDRFRRARDRIVEYLKAFQASLDI